MQWFAQRRSPSALTRESRMLRPRTQNVHLIRAGPPALDRVQHIVALPLRVTSLGVYRVT
jgi:hypothetical protein